MGAPSTTGGSGGPAPFLLKTYDMVDDTTTDEIVSWSPSHTSFIVWNPLEFARLLLPTYFKHNNFSSFIRQLNTYGFRKIDPERWEFANDDFIKDKKHLLKNIHRRKPIHSHSQPPLDPERAAFEEEIEKLTREKNDLDAKVSVFKMHHCASKSQLEDITERICGMEQRQEKLLTYLQKAVQNPAFIEHLAQKIEAMDLTAYNKKRRLPAEEYKFATETVELLDTGTCVPFKVDPPKSDKLGLEESSGLASAQQNLVLAEESESQICCQLNLSLASSPVQLNLSAYPSKATNMDVDVSGSQGSGTNANGGSKDDFGMALKNGNAIGNVGNSSEETWSKNQGRNSAALTRVNDQFWEQFLTERPGSLDNEEASSSYKALPNDEPEDRGSIHGMSKTAKNLGKLTL